MRSGGVGGKARHGARAQRHPPRSGIGESRRHAVTSYLSALLARREHGTFLPEVEIEGLLTLPCRIALQAELALVGVYDVLLLSHADWLVVWRPHRRRRRWRHVTSARSTARCSWVDRG
eukprot:scaffold155445_cov31-Tisochrysis_lutea.AAC.4